MSHSLTEQKTIEDNNFRSFDNINNLEKSDSKGSRNTQKKNTFTDPKTVVKIMKESKKYYLMTFIVPLLLIYYFLSSYGFFGGLFCSLIIVIIWLGLPEVAFYALGLVAYFFCKLIMEDCAKKHKERQENKRQERAKQLKERRY